MNTTSTNGTHTRTFTPTQGFVRVKYSGSAVFSLANATLNMVDVDTVYTVLARGSYRYAFQGQERDDEIKGAGNSYNYEYRMHDPRIGRFFAIDPLASKYPWYTPYQFSGNKVIHCIELEGLEEYIRTYTYDNGHATLLSVTKNSEMKLVVQDVINKTQPLYPTIFSEKYDKRTGQKMNPSEIGTEQYKYVDKKGNPLNIRRDYNGDYVEGKNELMKVYNKNYFGSIYIGPDNPSEIVEGKEIPDYRREPQDEVDAAALQHDKNYDAVNAKGFIGAVIDKKTTAADALLVVMAEKVKMKALTGLNDNITGKPITEKTLDRAKKVSLAFTTLVTTKIMR